MLYVITGPPCSGKSTYVREHAQPGDVVVDYDLLAVALGSPDSHDHPVAVRSVATAVRRAAIDAAIAAHRRGYNAWIVDTSVPTVRATQYLAAGAHIVTLTVDPKVLHERAAKERPRGWHTAIDRWTPAGRRVVRRRVVQGPRSRHRTGRPYRRAREEMLGIYGDVCHICGHHGAEEADHIVAVDADPDQPVDPHGMRPAHGTTCPCPVCGRKCNQERGARPLPAVQTQPLRTSRKW